VERAVGRVLAGADKETVIHEVFFTVLSSEKLRRNFQGGSLASWLATVAHHEAIDYWRRREREVGDEALEDLPGDDERQVALRTELKVMMARFQDRWLPQKFHAVFSARFVWQMSQREAADQLKMRRTTLAYQEIQIRRLIRRFSQSADLP
jgi:RNA polymerase sigma-70 factor (ECF subfamily)